MHKDAQRCTKITMKKQNIYKKLCLKNRTIKNQWAKQLSVFIQYNIWAFKN